MCNVSQSNLNCSLDVSNATHILSDSGLSLQTQFVQVTFIFVKKKPNLRDKNHTYKVEVASPEEQQFIVYTE